MSKTKTTKKRDPTYKRFPELLREESSAEEERYVRQRFVPIAEFPANEEGSMADLPQLDFGALDDDDDEDNGEKAGGGELTTGFLRYIVYSCAFDTPVHKLPPPQPGVDSDELCRDKFFAANAARDAARFKADVLMPHVKRLTARMNDACTTLGDAQVERFHRVMQTTPALKRVESSSGAWDLCVANITLANLHEEAFADLLQCVHVAYHFEKYTRYAACAALETLADDMTVVETWNALTGRAAALPVSQWAGTDADTSFVRECCQLWDVFTTTQSWLA